MSVSRFVAFLTPAFAALAGYVATEATKLPGAPVLDRGQLTVVFVGGAASATAAAVKWLHGRSAHELRAFDHVAEVERAEAYARAGSEADADAVRLIQDTVRELEGISALVSRIAVGVNALTERVDGHEAKLERVGRVRANIDKLQVGGRTYVPVPAGRGGEAD